MAAMTLPRTLACALVVVLCASDGDAQTRDRAAWIQLAKEGFQIPAGRTAIELLVEMNPLLASADPVLRDEVAYSAAETWIRAGKVSASELRRLIDLWFANSADGLGSTGDDRVFKRTFSALCLSLIAARDVAEPFLEAAEVDTFFVRTLDYFERERDLRGFDPVKGWMHSVAHTADVLKFLARNPKLAAGADRRLLAAVREKIDASPTVFTWGEMDRVALALQSAVRRPDADAQALTAWVEEWIGAHKSLWSKGPHVNATAFARVENVKQVMRSLHAALAMEARPTPTGDGARQIVLAGLAKMR